MRRDGDLRRPVPWDLVVSVLVALLLLGPALAPGYLLRGDMVFVPHQPWKGAWLGLDGAYPRAVPMDALVAVLTWVVPGWVLQKILLVGALVGGGLGAARLARWAPGCGPVGRAAAITLFLWNPYVVERLLIGQWALVVGYAALPWAAWAAARVALGSRTGWAALLGALAVAAVASPPSGLMAAGVAVVVAAWRRSPRRALTVLGAAVLMNLPWLLPAVAADTVALSSQAARSQFEEFAAAPESAAGLLPSLLSLGGIWKSSIVPPERQVAALVLGAAALSLVALTGAVSLMLRGRNSARQAGLPAEPPAGSVSSPVSALAVIAGVAFLVAAAPALPGVPALLGDVATRVPAVGLLRDSQRFLAPASLVLLPGVAAAVTWLERHAAPGLESLRAVALLLVAAPVLMLPSAVWGLTGALRAVHYPAAWDEVAGHVGAGESTVVLPWAGAYRGFAWNDYRAVLDPAPRYLRGEVLVDDRVLLGDVTLPGESPRLAAVTRALETAATPQDSRTALLALGVRWVLVETGPDGGRGARLEPAGDVVVEAGDLRLIDLGPTS